MQRRSFLSTLAAGSALVLGAPHLLAQTSNAQSAGRSPEALPRNEGNHPRYRPPQRFGLGGAIALGDGVERVVSRGRIGALLASFQTTAWNCQPDAFTACQC